MKKKRYNSKTAGDSLEELFESLLIAEQIPYIRESTVNNTRKRVKGNVDFKISNPVVFIECKVFTNTLSFKYLSEIHDIKWSQIQYLQERYMLYGLPAYFVVKETHDSRLILIHIKDFIELWCNTSRKSLNLDIALEIGKVITDAKFLKGG